MLRKIKFKEFKDLYRKHIVKDFPSSERPNLEGFRKRMLKYNEGNRGKGIGTKILKELGEKYSNKKGILLEVEDPDFAKNENEKSIQERRIRFYERANFQVVENLKVELFMVNFNIMLHNITSASTEISEVEKVMKQFYYTIIDKKRLKYINIKTI